MPYIEYTDEQKYLANHADIAALLESHGEKLKRVGHEYRWVSGHDSVTIRGNEWYQHSADRGGYPVNFCIEFLGLNYQESMSLLLGGNVSISVEQSNQKEKQKFTLPEADANMRRIYAYLTKQRGIAPEVITEFVHQRKLFEDADYHNAVFVGTDEDGNPAWAGKRSTSSYSKTYRGNVGGSDKRYSFHHAGGSKSLFVFEAPVDMMSYITMYPDGWKDQNYISLDGVADKPLLHFLSQNPHITNVYLCLDNDDAGREANVRIGEMLDKSGLRVGVITPELKDWNADLTASKSIGMEMTTI